MAGFVVYDTADGRIIRSGFCSDADVELQPQGSNEAVVLSDGPVRFENHFVSNGEVMPRPEMDLSLDKSAVAVNEIVTISGVPQGCEVVFDDELHTINDGVMEWSSAVAGSYELLFSFFPFREEVIVIEVAK